MRQRAVRLLRLRLRARRQERRQRVCERPWGFGEARAILRALRPCDARLDGPEIEGERVGVRRVLRAFGVEEPLLLAIRLDERDLVVGAARQAEVAERLRVYGENAAGGAVFG